MKVRRNIYIIIGGALIILNLLIDIVEFTEHNSYDGTSYTIGYFIGSHILLIFGLILFRLAYKVHKKIKSNDLEEMVENIGRP